MPKIFYTREIPNLTYNIENYSNLNVINKNNNNIIQYV